MASRLGTAGSKSGGSAGEPAGALACEPVDEFFDSSSPDSFLFLDRLVKKTSLVNKIVYNSFLFERQQRFKGLLNS
jgi:hypothetical protein